MSGQLVSAMLQSRSMPNIMPDWGRYDVIPVRPRAKKNEIPLTSIFRHKTNKTQIFKTDKITASDGGGMKSHITRKNAFLIFL